MLLIALTATSVWGQLTATVTPGYQFSVGERPTTDTLNQLGQPTIAIAGTISGTVGLASNSVSGVYLTDNLPDGRTLSYTNTSPRSLQVIAAGIGTNELGANVFTLVTNAALTEVTNIVNTNVFVSAQLLLTNGVMTANVAHGLGKTPSVVQCVLVCTNNTSDHGYAVGDEIQVAGLTGAGSSAAWALYGANATNVFLTSQNTTPALQPKAGGVQTGVTSVTNWALKFYARP